MEAQAWGGHSTVQGREKDGRTERKPALTAQGDGVGLRHTGESAHAREGEEGNGIYLLALPGLSSLCGASIAMRIRQWWHTPLISVAILVSHRGQEVVVHTFNLALERNLKQEETALSSVSF